MGDGGPVLGDLHAGQEHESVCGSLGGQALKSFSLGDVGPDA